MILERTMFLFADKRQSWQLLVRKMPILRFLEMNGPKKPKVMEEIGRLNKEKDQLQMQLRDVVRYVEIFQVKRL